VIALAITRGLSGGIAHRTSCDCLDRRRERATIACPLVEGLPKTSPSPTVVRCRKRQQDVAPNCEGLVYEHARDRQAWLTAAMTELHKGELVARRWRDIDWVASRIRVRHNYRDEFGSPKSKRSTRSVPMADAAGGEFDRLSKTSRYAGPDDLVFAHSADERSVDQSAVMASLLSSRLLSALGPP
jgi:integrase